MPAPVNLPIARLHPRARIPERMSADAAGLDLAACLDAEIVLAPGERGLVPTGLAMAIPAGLEAQVRPRSGLAARHGVTVLNSPGTIDPDYRGEVKVILINHGREPFTVRDGERIAQLVIASVSATNVVAVTSADELPPSQRGGGGFGSTG